MTKKPEALILDLGGVIYDIDADRTINTFSKLGIKSFDKIYTLREQDPIIDDLEKGNIDPMKFIEEVNHFFETDLAGEDIINSWNALLIGLPKENLDLLEKLKKQYRIFLLSNTNPIHMDAINKELKEKFDVDDFRKFFHQAYYSYETGYRKPDVKIYRLVIDQHNLNPQNTVFIDDNKDNISGAQKAGLEAILKDKKQTLTEFLLYHHLI